jgi:putative transcriptional regulator
MTKSAFDKIAAGMQSAIDYVEGEREGFVTHIPEDVDLKSIRKGLGLSQPKFAEAFGFTVGRVRDWEQKRFAIDASSRALLTIIEKEPLAAMRALGPEGRKAATLHATREDALKAARKALRSPRSAEARPPKATPVGARKAIS